MVQSPTGRILALTGLLTLAVGACTDDADNVAPEAESFDIPVFASHGESGPQSVQLCKFNDAPDTWAQFEITGSGGTLPQGNLVVLPALPFPMAEENCAVVWVTDGSVGSHPLTITETDMTTGTSIERIVVFQDRAPNSFELFGTNTVVVDVDFDHGAQISFKNQGEPRDGGEGCTPGAWKNRLYKQGLWPAPYDVNPDLDEYFDTTGYPFGSDSFLTALRYGGNEADDKLNQEAYKLMRSAVAALLNAASQSYAYTEAEVIALTNAALASGDWVVINDLKDDFDFENNRGCALDSVTGRPLR